MFTPGRYVVVDDNQSELRALVEALHRLGSPCVGVHYNAATGVDPQILRGVRVLFLDLHLVGGVQVGKQEKAFEVIRDLLDNGIAENAGPYVIILWTAHAEERDEFENYIAERMEAQKRPLAILSLSKNDYLKPDGADAEKLQADIIERIGTDRRLKALLLWERDVLAAASDTLASLGDLIDPEDRTPARYGDRLDEVLSVLACAAAGRQHAIDNVRAAVSGALTPILADRIANQGPDPEAEEAWASAVTKINEATGLAPAGRVNTMLHLALPPAEAIKATDWGAVTILPDQQLTDEIMLRRFDLKHGELMFNSCPAATKPGRAACRMALLRLGASCDHAQGRRGPLACAPTIIVPVETALKDPAKTSKALISTPVLDIPDMGPVVMYVDARYQISLVRSDLEGLQPLCRIRDQLLMQISAHCAEYTMRPGIVAIEPQPIPPDEVSPPDAQAVQAGHGEQAAE
jgi:hypothetical protein